MKIIEPNVTEVTEFEGVDNFYKAVARAARICYASDKTTEDKALVERLIESKHFSPFEHAVIYLDIDKLQNDHLIPDYYKPKMICILCVTNKYSIQKGTLGNSYYAINGRILIESIIKYNNKKNENTSITKTIDETLRFINKYQERRSFFRSFIVDTSIGCTREMNRHHDNFYICEQSTRYCNFSKDKFGGEVAFNKPYWYNTKNDVYKEWWKGAMKNAEMLYMTAIKNIPEDLRNCSDNEFGMGFHIDEARGILPLDTHTRAIYTATIEEWEHFIDLRLKGITGKPHGDIQIIADKINNIINK